MMTTLNFNITYTISANKWGSLYDSRPHIFKSSDEKSEYRSNIHRSHISISYIRLINGPQLYMNTSTNKRNFLLFLLNKRISIAENKNSASIHALGVE